MSANPLIGDLAAPACLPGVHPQTLPEATLREAVHHLRRGGLVAFPTETVYGLGANARNPDAVARVFAAKGRPSNHPLIVHLGDSAQIHDWAAEVTLAARALVRHFWPGPLTLILPRRPEVHDAVTGGLDSVALRVPAHPVARALLQAFGGGIAAPSANRYGRVSPTCAAHVCEELGDAVDLVVDGGACPVGIESTIVDLSAGVLRLLRPGAISAADLTAVTGQPCLGPQAPGAPRAPGSAVSHYAPIARVVLATPQTMGRQLWSVMKNHARVGLLSSTAPDHLPTSVTWLALPHSLEGQANALYGRLRAADHLGLQAVVAVLPPAIGIGVAIQDRLRRAAGCGLSFNTMAAFPEPELSDVR